MTEGQVVEIYTDGSCRGNPGPGGWGAILRFKGQEKELYGGEAATTNNRMELTAVIRALEALKRPSRVRVYTDSQYVQKGISEWVRDWLRVLGFELDGGRFGCYAPPFRSRLWLDRFAFMEKAGARWWPITGGIYVVRAVKRVAGMRLITPAWRRERARRRALAPIPQRSHKNHD